MSEADKFTSAEWQTLKFAPFWTFVAVASADGKIDQQKITAYINELADARRYKCPLVREVFGEVFLSMASDTVGMSNAQAADGRAYTTGLTQVADILDAKTDHDDGVMFRAALMFLAVNIAKASGRWYKKWHKKVNKKEVRAIGRISILLRINTAEYDRVASSYQDTRMAA